MLSLSVDVHDGVGTVRVAGDLDALSSDKLRRVALGALSDGASSLVLDCSELAFIDSTGLTVLIEASESAGTQSGAITIRNPPPLMLRLLQITGLDEAFDIQQ
jgi:anti-anti-sigma factor